MRIALMGLLIAVPAVAQTVDASIWGGVRDSAGNSITGAIVTARNVATGVEWTVTSTSSGRFALLQLPLGGPYTVTARQVGWRPQSRSGYLLTLGSRVVVDLVLARTTVQLDPVTVSGESGEIRTPTIGANYRERGAACECSRREPQLHGSRRARADDWCARFAARATLDVDGHSRRRRSGEEHAPLRPIRRWPVHTLDGSHSRIRSLDGRVRRDARTPGRRNHPRGHTVGNEHVDGFSVYVLSRERSRHRPTFSRARARNANTRRPSGAGAWVGRSCEIVRTSSSRSINGTRTSRCSRVRFRLLRRKSRSASREIR